MKYLSSLKTSYKIIIAIIVLALIVEVVWVIGFSKSYTLNSTNFTQVGKSATFSLETGEASTRVGSQVVVSVNLSSNSLTDGADLIVTYDPTYLKVNTDVQKSPLKIGSLYDSYPYNVVDEKIGKIAVSGITTKSGGILGNGLFGTLTFSTLKAGQTEIKIDFTKGSTTDSNVTENSTAKDLLSEVKNLKVNIVP